MDNALGTKQRLVFFQWDHRPNENAARFLRLHMQHHVKCLALFFDVTVIDHDCDYAEICDRHQPDLALFESGYRTHGSRRIKVTNTRAHPTVPKLGFHNADAWCDRRAGFISDMDHWDIETFFTIAVAMPEYTPSIADRLFIWPNFIDPELFRDYGQHKTIPVLLTGQAYGLYPWRQKVYRLLADCFPSLTCPQFSYESNAARRMMHGEDYARAINASLFVPCCGSMGREVVRKHFEIPAAKACLITEKTPALVSAGFVHMENCVFADETNVVDHLDYLLDRPDKLRRITEAGHRLVHSRHTLSQRSQILQWYLLNRQRAPHQKIVQTDPFAPLALVGEATAHTSPPLIGDSPDRALLKQGDARLWQGEIEAAQLCYRQCLHYVHYLPEARFRLALSSLHIGDAANALAGLTMLIETTLVDYGAADPDPVEWAYFIIALLCQGRIDEAVRCVSQYPGLRHPELGHVLRIIWLLNGPADMPGEEDARHDGIRRSIHYLPDRSHDAWVRQLAGMLRACGQDLLADRLCRLPASAMSASVGTGVRAGPVRNPWPRARWYRGIDAVLARWPTSALRPGVPAMPEFRYLAKLGRQALKTVVPRPLARPLRGLEHMLGQIHTLLATGRWTGSALNSLEAILASERCRTVLLIRGNQERSGGPDGEMLTYTRGATAGSGTGLLREEVTGSFDAVIIEDASMIDDRIMAILLRTPVVSLQNICTTDRSWAAFEALCSRGDFQVIDSDPAVHGGHALVRRFEGHRVAAK